MREPVIEYAHRRSPGHRATRVDLRPPWLAGTAATTALRGGARTAPYRITNGFAIGSLDRFIQIVLGRV